MCNGERDQFHEVVLHGETLVFSSPRPLRAVTDVESGSTFRETCLATEVRKSFTKPTMLQGATSAETCFAVAHKFQLKVSTCNGGFRVSTIGNIITIPRMGRYVVTAMHLLVSQLVC